MKKAVIFDLDGTLADTLKSLAYCTNRALADFGYPPIGTERFKKFVGNGARMQIIRALRFCGAAEEPVQNQTGAKAQGQPDEDGFVTVPKGLDEVLSCYLDYFSKNCLYGVTPYEGIPELLAGLKSRGIRLAVLSNKPDAQTKEVVEGLFGPSCFDRIMGQSPYRKKKPAPDGVWEIGDFFGVRPEEILYAGDSGVDMETAKAAGTTAAGVCWGFRTKEELLAHGADILIHKPEEMLKWLEESN